MAFPTSAECKLLLSFDMVAKTMTAYTSDVINDWPLLTYIPSYGVVEDPLGNTYDIDEIFLDGGGGAPSQTWDAPLDSDGNVLNGSYKILLPTLFLNDDSTNLTYTDVDSAFTLNYTAPTVVLTATIDCISPSFVSTDATDYRVIDPTSQGYITPTTVSYAHNLYYPVTSNGYPDNETLTSDLIITRGDEEFYQGTQTATVSHSVSYTFVDLLVVTDTLEGDLETKVDCSGLLCSLTCAINKLWRAMSRSQNKNATEYQLQLALYTKVNADLMLARQNLSCGDSVTASSIAVQIKNELGECKCDDCHGKDGTPITRNAGW